MTISLHVSPVFDVAKDRREMELPTGLTLAEMVRAALPDLPASLSHLVRVVIGSRDLDQWAAVPQDRWHAVKPKPGRIVVVRLVPGNSGILRSALSIAITVAAIAAGQFYAPALVGATGLSLGASQAIITAGVAFAGNLLLNALIPVKPPSNDQGSPTYDVQGWRNTNTPDGVIPHVLGRHRIAPPYASSPVTETIGRERYVSAIFLVGYGPQKLEGLRIGDTDIGTFGSDVEVEIREGYPTDEQFSLVYETTIEEGVGTELEQSQGVTRFSALDADELSVDFHFPGGLFWVDDDGDKKSAGFSASVRYRLLGTNTWNEQGFATSGSDQEPFFAQFRWTVPTRGRYEVVVTCTSERNERGSNRGDWACLRTHRPEYPINVDQPMAMVAVRARASKLLNGALDTFSLIATTVTPDWDAASATWITRPTRNPASLYRLVRQGVATMQPLTDTELNLPQLQDWHNKCVARGLNYDRVQDYSASAEDVCRDICAQGFASPQDQGALWGVVIDEPKSTPVAAITPRNADAIESTITYAKLPEAFRVSFLDETNAYEDAERIVPAPWLPGSQEPTTFESLEMIGETNPDMIYKRAQRRFHELDLRRQEYSAVQDIEGLAARRGDLVLISNDVFVSSQVPARAVVVLDGQRVVLDEDVEMTGGKTYAVRFTSAEGVSILRSVQVFAGTHRTISLTGTGWTCPALVESVLVMRRPDVQTGRG